MYMQLLRNYVDIEHDQIGDPDEGLSYSLIHDVKVEVDGVEIEEVIGPVRLVDSTEYNPYIFCMYSLVFENIKTERNTIDSRCLGFGDHAVVVKDRREFLKRLRLVFEKDCVSRLNGALVKYVNRESYNGEMGAFRKYDNYDYQLEYRYVWENSGLNATAVTLKIGDLSDIAVLVPSEKLNSLIKRGE